MKLTLANIKELKRNSNSPLTKRVCNYVIGEWSDYSGNQQSFVRHDERNRALLPFRTFRR